MSDLGLQFASDILLYVIWLRDDSHWGCKIGGDDFA